MIVELYTFAPGSYVVAEEWNTNFNVLYTESSTQTTILQDAWNSIAFPDSDMSQIFAAINNLSDSHFIQGSSVDVAVGQEYYRSLMTGEDLDITLPNTGLNGEVRILIELTEDRSLLPFTINPNYTGTVIINHYNNNVFRAGFYYIMIYEAAGVAQVKLIWTGVLE